jgi:hypothetical protein
LPTNGQQHSLKSPAEVNRETGKAMSAADFPIFHYYQHTGFVYFLLVGVADIFLSLTKKNEPHTKALTSIFKTEVIIIRMLARASLVCVRT